MSASYILLRCGHCDWQVSMKLLGILSKAEREEEVDMRMNKHEMRCLGRALETYRVITKREEPLDNKEFFEDVPCITRSTHRDATVIYWDSDDEGDEPVGNEDDDDNGRRKVPFSSSSGSSSEPSSRDITPGDTKLVYTLTFRPVIRSKRAKDHPEQMLTRLQRDPDIVPGTIRPWSVECRWCRTRIQVLGRVQYDDAQWRTHKETCDNRRRLAVYPL